MFIDPKKKSEYIEGMLIVFERKKQEQLQEVKPVKPGYNNVVVVIKPAPK